ISLDNKGIFLTIAFKDHIKIIDLRTRKVCSNFFMPRIGDNSFIVDVSTPISFSQNSPEQYVVVVNEKGILNLKKHTVEFERPLFSHVRDLKTGDFIDKVHFPDKVRD